MGHINVYSNVIICQKKITRIQLKGGLEMHRETRLKGAHKQQKRLKRLHV